MIGVFDSGDGGLCTVEKIRELMPCADICFFADRQNAPPDTSLHPGGASFISCPAMTGRSHSPMTYRAKAAARRRSSLLGCPICSGPKEPRQWNSAPSM